MLLMIELSDFEIMSNKRRNGEPSIIFEIVDFSVFVFEFSHGTEARKHARPIPSTRLTASCSSRLMACAISAHFLGSTIAYAHVQNRSIDAVCFTEATPVVDLLAPGELSISPFLISS